MGASFAEAAALAVFAVLRQGGDAVVGSRCDRNAGAEGDRVEVDRGSRVGFGVLRVRSRGGTSAEQVKLGI